MRFISIFTHEPTNRAPTQAEMAAMGKLVEEAMKEGWLIQTEGVSFGAKGVRVHKSAGGKVDGHRRPVRRGQGGHRRLRVAQGEFQGGDRQAHEAVPRSRRPGDLRDLSALRDAGRELSFAQQIGGAKKRALALRAPWGCAVGPKGGRVAARVPPKPPRSNRYAALRDAVLIEARLIL